MELAMERLSTGQRINSAADDAAGLAMVERMNSQIRGLTMATKNAHDGIALLRTVENALVEVSGMLQRMRELALQASNGTTTSTDRNYLSAEYANLLTEIDRIAENTQWNGKTILNHTSTASSTFAYQVGANGGQTIAVDFGNMTDTVSGVFTELKASHSVITSTTTASALTQGASAVVAVDAAITAVNTQRATFGAAMNQLTYAVDNLSLIHI